MAKTILITGTSKGIGLALSKQLLDKGNTVIGTSRNGNIDSISHDAFESMSLDLSSMDSIHEFEKWSLKKEIKLDLLINNAGIGPDLDTYTPEESSFDSTFDVNVKGTVFFTETMIPFIEDGGRILNVSSKMGSIDCCVSTDAVAYRMSKSALNMYTKILSKRLEGTIDVASVHPGWVRTTITKSSVNGRLSPEESAERIVDYIETQFDNGDFWDVEDRTKLRW